jgi:hypothetical protein
MTPNRSLLPFLAGASWLALALFLLFGCPPSVDLPAHAAQLQLMSDWLAGDPPTREQFSLHFVLGYGLWYWCVLPVAMVLNGAWAAKGALFFFLLACPASLHFYLRQFKQPAWLTLLALPLCFSVSYWYGFISTLVTLPAIFLGLGLWRRWREEGRRGDLWGIGATLLFCVLNHPLSYAAMAAAILGAEMTRDRSPRHVLRLLGLLALPSVVLVPYLLGWLDRSRAGEAPGFAYRLDTHHLQWFWKNTRKEGLVSLLFPLGFCGAVLVQRIKGRTTARAAFGAAAGVGALFLLVPYHGGGALMLDVRLPVVVAGLALAALRVDGWSKRWTRALVALSLVCLGEALFVHHRFRVFSGPAQDVFLNQRTVHSTSNDASIPPFTRHPYLEHFFEWETARYGGYGDHLFADAQHVPIRARVDAPRPAPSIVYGFAASPPAELRGCAREAQSPGVARWRCPRAGFTPRRSVRPGSRSAPRSLGARRRCAPARRAAGPPPGRW